MRKNHEKMVKAFCELRNAHGDDSPAGPRWTVEATTDGAILFSYSMPIARRVGGELTVIQYDRAPTATTRAHVRAVEEHFQGRITKREMI